MSLIVFLYNEGHSSCIQKNVFLHECKMYDLYLLFIGAVMISMATVDIELGDLKSIDSGHVIKYSPLSHLCCVFLFTDVLLNVMWITGTLS